MAHLEHVLDEWYEWRGYLVRRNVLVGPRPQGGYEGELDVIAFNPETHHLVHVEASLDADSWERREARFEKKFERGRRFVRATIFPWLTSEVELEQIAILPARRSEKLGGGRVVSVDDFMKEVRDAIVKHGPAASAAIPEQFGLLRSIQFAVVGYHRAS